MASNRRDFLDWLSELSPRAIVLHPAFLFLVCTVITMGAAIQLWQKYQSRIVDAQVYGLTAEQITIAPEPPPWVEQDLSRVLLDGFESQPSLLDTDLVSRTVNQFQTVGYVQKVEGVRKSELGLKVDLVFRQPIAMVQLKNKQLLPVDRHGYIMRIPITPAQAQRFIRIRVRPPHAPDLQSWAKWPDARVQKAAHLSSFLAEDWKAMGLYHIISHDTVGQPVSRPFQIWTANRCQVIWGSAPGSEKAGEATGETKLAALREFVERYGPLDKIPQLDDTHQIDVRSGKVVIKQGARTASAGDNWWK